MTRHEVKCYSYFYKQVTPRGFKTFEIRRNDRDYREGDQLLLKEICGCGCDEITGDETLYSITYITDFEQKPGYVVMAVEPVKL